MCRVDLTTRAAMACGPVTSAPTSRQLCRGRLERQAFQGTVIESDGSEPSAWSPINLGFCETKLFLFIYATDQDHGSEGLQLTDSRGAACRAPTAQIRSCPPLAEVFARRGLAQLCDGYHTLVPISSPWRKP